MKINSCPTLLKHLSIKILGRNVVLLILVICPLFKNILAQTNTWVGSISTDYFNKYNWSDTNINFTNPTSYTLLIGAGFPNNCILNGGNSSNVNYRPGRLNTLTGSVFTENGAVYPNNNDSLNGSIILNSPADFNLRSDVYVGRNSSGVITINGGKITSRLTFNVGFGNAGSSATINLPAGSLNAGTNLNIANGTGLTGRINITGGSVNVPGTLNIGTNGSIYISGIGLLKLTGDKRTQLNSLIADGRLSCTTGKSLSVVYDGTSTIASIAVNANSMITEYPDSVVLRTTDLVCSIDKNTANIISYRYKGKETVANKSTDTHQFIYHDFTTSKGFETIYGCTYEIVQDSTEFAHVVFKRPYNPTSNVTPVDCELHYALKKDDKGVYVYSKLEHKSNYPTFDIGSWRQVWWLAANNGAYVTERIYVDSLRNWQMPAPNDTYETTPYAEIIKMTSGVRAGKFDGKYEYSLRMWDNPVWGHASNINNIGIWCLNASCEYFNEGPMHHDLVSAAGIIHQCMNGVHYGDRGMTADTLTSWTKVYGPYMLLITDKSTGDSNWAAAKQRQLVEAAQWPYSWVKDTTAYPAANKRGAITGKFVVSDSKKPNVTGANFWIGVTNLSDGAGNFQFECKDYQYWIRTDGDGNFTIPNVRPGTYSLFAFGDGAVGEYRQDNVLVTAGNTNDLGTITKTIDRSYGNLVWEIGTPNRMADEFKLGKFDYCEGYVERKFRDTFPAIIEYNTADNNWSSKLPYAHTKYPDTTFQPGDIWKWRLNFNLPTGLPTTGNARLTFAYASNDHAQQWIYVNNENSTFTTYFPDNGDGNAFIRQANYAKYSTKEVLIPMSRLKAGLNTITLAMPSNSAWVSHIMYDYISLEANLGATLPVTLLTFTAKANTAKQVQLNWFTTKEVNSKGFEVERSKDGFAFNLIGSVPSNSTQTNYSFIDQNPFSGNNFYRLKQMDADGKFVYSSTRIVNIDDNKISISPNPATSQIIVQSGGEIISSINLFNAEGKLMYVNNNITSVATAIEVSDYPAGIYIIKINSGGNIITKKIRKL